MSRELMTWRKRLAAAWAALTNRDPVSWLDAGDGFFRVRAIDGTLFTLPTGLQPISEAAADNAPALQEMCAWCARYGGAMTRIPSGTFRVRELGSGPFVGSGEPAP